MLREVFLASIFLAYMEPKLFFAFARESSPVQPLLLSKRTSPSTRRCPNQASDDRSKAMNSIGQAFLPQACYVHQDDTWGQFVDVADAEEELVRMSKFLSIRRHIDIPLMEGCPLDF